MATIGARRGMSWLVSLCLLTGGAACGQTEDDGWIPTAKLAVGQCSPESTVVHGVTLTRHPIVACTESHYAEVFSIGAVADAGQFPGKDELNQQAEDHCVPEIDAYVMDLMSLPGDAQLVWFVPDQKRWSDGERYIVCLFAVEHPLARSLRMDASTLDEYQIRYLAAAKESNDVDSQLSAEPPPSWQDMRTLAAKMAGVLAKKRDALDAGPWPQSARAAVKRLIAEVDKAIPLWQKAGKAKTESDVRRLIAQAEAHSARDDALDVRRNLGLPTAQGMPATS